MRNCLLIRKMSTHKFDIEKFNELNDFTLWKIKMRALLVKQGCFRALEREDKLLDTLSADEKNEILAKAHGAMLLSFTDEVLCWVQKTYTSQFTEPAIHGAPVAKVHRQHPPFIVCQIRRVALGLSGDPGHPASLLWRPHPELESHPAHFPNRN